MVLPHVPKEKILNALKAFDQECRNKPEWVNWQSSQMQKYALSYEGKHYPPKMIISLATGVPRNQFTGGNQSNNYLSRYGFKIIRLINGRPLSNSQFVRLKHLVQNDPELLIRGNFMTRNIKGAPGYTFEYLKCY